MATKRLELDAKLREILGSSNVYFQPPESKKLQYPCIIYRRDQGNTVFADDNPYRINVRYTITVIDRNPDSEIYLKVAQLQTATYDRHYTADNLNHDVITLYY